MEDVATLVKRLHRLGLREHSGVLAAVLPFDGFTLKSLASLAMSGVVDYLEQCRAADAAVFGAVLEKDRQLPDLAEHLATMVTDVALGNRKRDLEGRIREVKCNPGNMGLAPVTAVSRR